MLQLRDPSLLADLIEHELSRYRLVGRALGVPSSLVELSDALERIAAILREADQRGQSVDVSDEVIRLIQQFRAALRAVAGTPAEA